MEHDNERLKTLSLSLSFMHGRHRRSIEMECFIKTTIASRDIARISGFQMFAGDVAQFSSSAQLARSVRKSARIGRQTPRYLVAANDVET